MKKLIYLFGVFTLIVLIAISCEKDNEKSNNNQQVFSGQLINNSTCKKTTSHETNTPDTLSCVEYTFDNINNKLILKHINTGFNCCPDSLYVQTSLHGDTIVIQEFEVNALCDCNCLYDLEIELNGIEAKKYHIKFIEPYAIDQQEIIFEADLVNDNKSEFCVTRKLYPWGIIDDLQLEFKGKLIKNSSCKNKLKSLSNKTTIPDSLSCIKYSFDNANNILTMKHINAGFNCCPDSLYIQTSLNGDTIIIQEFEANAPCNCNCLYDLDIELHGIKAKEYQIVFIEPYAIDQQEIRFNIDLKTNNESDFCVTRKQYPWGIN